MTEKNQTSGPSHVIEAPAGFTKADTDVDNYEAWDFDKHGQLEGIVEKVKTVVLVRRGEEKDVRMAVVALEDGGKCILWESANLGDFFDNLAPQMDIVVRPGGSQTLSGGRHMKLFDAYYR